jgi:D-glycero-D-manno-heptose 1,7-bisphosphate phosphatase
MKKKSQVRRLLFLDRDGVVNLDKHYVYRIQDIEYVEGIFHLCKYFSAKNFEIVIVTNQSGIARGFFSEGDFESVMVYILEKFQSEGIQILSYAYCPHRPTDLCKCRKPLPGLFTQAMERFNALPENCISIGDRERDIVAAISAGIQQNYLLQDKELSLSNLSGTVLVNSLSEIIKFHESRPFEA